MSDRQSDQGTELFPRRSLSGPSTVEASRPTSAPTPAETPSAAAAATSAPTSTPGKAPTGGSTPAGSEDSDRSSPVATWSGAGQETPAPTSTTTKQRKTKSKAPRKAPRKARLRVVRLDPWSVMKMAFALSIALAIVTVVAVFIVWSVLDTAGVWDSINTSVDTVVNAEGSEGFDIRQWVGRGPVMGVTLLVSVANVVLLTALATLAAFVYNLAAALLGGFEVTLAEDR